MLNEWSQYLSRVTNDAPGADVARRLGVDAPKVSHWRRGTRMPSVSDCIAVARAYGRPPLEGLVAAGYLAPEEASEQVTVAHHNIGDFTAAELAAELLRRASAGTTDLDPT